MKIISPITQFFVGLISAINTLGTAWVAIVVIVIGMYFALQANKAGLPSDIASGVIGAGIGLLTGQTMANRPGTHTTLDITPPVAPTPPTTPEPPTTTTKETP